MINAGTREAAWDIYLLGQYRPIEQWRGHKYRAVEVQPQMVRGRRHCCVAVLPWLLSATRLLFILHMNYFPFTSHIAPPGVWVPAHPTDMSDNSPHSCFLT